SLRNATRWKTYALPGGEHTGKICLNGPPAHLFEPGDLVVILSLGLCDEEEVRRLVPRVVFVDGGNRIERCEEHPLFDERGDVNWHALEPKQA
ncbi:aspartate 1-decarboxylase, partial [Paenibacillus sp.]|uniref:aspartate 1-decarboxylase n=1 Tax=Paenibacillus sp. TaxID=58172 RepID=UPI002D42C9B3